jgi:hypothetical protein
LGGLGLETDAISRPSPPLESPEPIKEPTPIAIPDKAEDEKTLIVGPPEVGRLSSSEPNLEEEPKDEKLTLVLSPTSLTDFQLCARMFNYRKVQGFGPIHKADYMEKGSLGHSILATFYRQRMKEVPFGDAVMAAIDKARKEYIDKFEVTVDDAEALIGICRDYFLDHQHDGWEPIAVEAPFSKTLLDTPKLHILMEGIIDLVVKHPQIPVLPIDHKFKSRTKPAAAMSNQYQCYAWALDVHVLIENEVGIQKNVPKRGRFHRYTLNYEPAVLEDWANWAIHWAAEIEAAIRGDFFPPKNASCHIFNNPCNFIDICKTNPEQREWLLPRACKKRERSGKSVYDYRDEK